VAQQVGAALGIGILVTVFAAADHGTAGHPLAVRDGLAHGVAASLTGSVVFLALALAVVLVVMRRPAAAPVTQAEVAR
jgi:hypothetical protein